MAMYTTITLLRRLFGSIGESRKMMVLSIIMLVIGCMALLYAPVLSGNVLDYLSNSVTSGVEIDLGKVSTTLIIIALLFAVGQGLSATSNKIMVNISGDVTRNFRLALHDKLQRLPINYLDTHSHGNVTARLTNDLTCMETLIKSDITNLFMNIIVVICVLAMMIVINPLLALVYVILIPVGFLIMKWITAKTSRSFRVQQTAVGELNGHLSDIITNHTLLRSYNMEEQYKEKFDEINEEFHEAYINAKIISGFAHPLSVIINNIGYICTAVFGAYLIIQGQLTVGGFLAYLMYGQMLNDPLGSMNRSLVNVKADLSALERLFEIFDAAEEPAEIGKKHLDHSSVEGRIEFRNVVFGYSPGDKLLNGVSFIVEPGSTVAIVGPSGAGKTTLINLLMRFYDIQDGSISLDGMDINDIFRNDLRGTFGVVLQEPWLFGGTIAENIGYGKENATFEEIRNVCRIVGCDTFIEKLPQGYGTIVSQENSRISAGEKQLLVLARTLISDPKILILDEATANIDSRTEAMVVRTMREMMEGRTTFVIAHRLFTIRNADKIIFMKDGKVREIGTHESLMKLNGHYADMYRNMSA